MLCRMFRAACVILVFLVTTAASAQLSEVTPFAGVQTGGVVELDEENNDMNSAPAFGVMVTFDRGRGRKLDLVVSHQSTRAERQDPFEPFVSTDVSVTTFQIGGRYFWDPDRRIAPYVAATGGGTYLTVGGADGLYFSFALGGGVDVPLSARTALRVDGRFLTTMIGDRVEIACTDSGQSCSGMAQGAQFIQFTASTGLVIRF